MIYITEIMKTVVPVCLLFVTSCFAVENTTTLLEQQLKVHKREKQYLVEDDSSEESEQKRDERQSTPVKNNHNPIDPMANSRMANVRLQPPPRQVLNPGVMKKPINCRVDTPPKIIPTKIPVILKTGRVVPGPAHALRLKMLENKINDLPSNLNKGNTLRQNAIAKPALSKDGIPYFTIEDKSALRTEGRSSPNNIDDEKLNLQSNGTLNRDGKETSGKDGNSINDGKINSHAPETVQKPVPFFVDEPEPLPPSLRRQTEFEYTASQSKEVTPNKLKEIPIAKKGKKKPKKEEARKKDNENDDEADDPNIVRISNGTHLISIKKIQNQDRYIIDHLTSRDGENVPTEERIVNQPLPKAKPITDEPEKHYLGVTDLHKSREKNVGLGGPAFGDTKNKEKKDQNQGITITKHNYEECEEKSPISPPITLQPIKPPMTSSEGNQESWNYLHNPNPYYQNPYNQNIYDLYRKNYGLITQGTTNGQEINDPRNFGAQIKPNIDPYALNSVITLPYYPNGNPPKNPDSESLQYPYIPNTYETQPETENTACPIRPEVILDNKFDRIWSAWKDIEIKIRQAQNNGTEIPLDIDIRRNFDDISDGINIENGIGKVPNPYAISSLPINVNGALIYPYVNPGYRYMR